MRWADVYVPHVSPASMSSPRRRCPRRRWRWADVYVSGLGPPSPAWARGTGDKFAYANLMTWLVGRLHAFVRRRRSGTVYGPPHAVQVKLRSVRTHVPEALLQNRARILIRFDRAKIARERAMLCADALELLRIRNKGRDLPPVPQRARPAEQRCRSCMRELRNFEIEERAPVARPAPAHAGPAQASLQDAEGQDLEILVVRARSLAGKAAAALLLCERTLPGRAVAHSIFRHMNDEDGTLRRLTAQISRAASRRRLHLLVRVAQFRGDPYA